MFTPSYISIVSVTIIALLVSCIVCIIYYSSGARQHYKLTNDVSCAVVIGEHPSASNPGRVVCFDVGRYPNVAMRIPFSPQYIRVAPGYKLIAFSQRQFGEPVRYRMDGPAERIILCDGREGPESKINSLIVTLGITRGVQVDDCKALVRMKDGSELCVSEGNPQPSFASTPVSIDVQKGYQLIATSQRHFMGERVADFVGPMQRDLVNPKTQSTKSSWAAIKVQPCLLTLYAQVNMSGMRRCVNGPMPSILTFRPMSFALADDTRLRVYSEKNFAGEIVFEAYGPRADNCPKATIGRWGSLHIESIR